MARRERKKEIKNKMLMKCKKARIVEGREGEGITGRYHER